MAKGTEYSGWLKRPRASRHAVLKELRSQAAAWADPDNDASQKDADTLLAAVELLERIDKELDG